MLAWIFASWTRPLVVMSIIPFGLVGAIWGHDYWDVPLSMFSVVGLIGMTGIIINDAIVLITTIDDYATRRGLVPSIIDAAADRLRPVMLTTMTTVLGLAPLLFERSQQAQFLKPTVITLVYGLGFGMVLVLLVVPALVAAQRDMARPLAALRRVWRAPSRAVRVTVALAGLAMTGWFAATLGRALMQGGLPGAVADLAPALAGADPVLAALVLFALGALGITLIAYLLSAAVLGLLSARRRA